MSSLNQYVQALKELKGNNQPPASLFVNNEEFRRRAEQFERESFLYESSQFVTDDLEDEEGDGGDNKTPRSPASVIDLYEYANSAAITDMIIEFISSTDVNIFNDTFTLNEVISSNQPLNFTL